MFHGIVTDINAVFVFHGCEEGQDVIKGALKRLSVRWKVSPLLVSLDTRPSEAYKEAPLLWIASASDADGKGDPEEVLSKMKAFANDRFLLSGNAGACVAFFIPYDLGSIDFISIYFSELKDFSECDYTFLSFPPLTCGWANNNDGPVDRDVKAVVTA